MIIEDFRQAEIKIRLRHEIEQLRQELKRASQHVMSKTDMLMDRITDLKRAIESSQFNRRLDDLIKIANLELGELTVTYDFGHGQQITSQGGTMFTLTDVQQVHAKATFKDARGNPADADMTNVQWSSSDETKITATPDTDGSGGCTFAAVGPLTDPANPVQVSVTDGNLTITDTIAVTASAATTVGIEFETATPEQPPTP